MKVAILSGYPLNKIVADGAMGYNSDLTHTLSRIKNIEVHVISVGKENKQIKKDNLIIHTIKKRKYISIPLLMVNF